MTLLHLLEENQKELGITIGLAHVHHGQRSEADQEAAYLEAYAGERNLPFHLAHFKDDFSEKAARDFRYRFFAEVIEEYHYTALLTAHHADDQAETVLMRLIRGSRLSHLSAIKERQDFAGGELIRPLLTFSKADFKDCFHFEDRSNQSQTYFRNRVRMTYLPQLKEENPKLSQHLCHLAQEISDLNATLSYFLADVNYRQLDIFKTYPQAVQKAFLEDYLSSFPELQVSKAQFEELLMLIREKKNQRFPIKSGYELVMDYHSFGIQKIHPKADVSTDHSVLKSGGILEFSGYLLAFNRQLEATDDIICLPEAEDLIISHRQEGDKILFGGHCRKIRRLFISQKIPSEVRDSAVFVRQSGQVMAVLGIAVSDLSKSLKSDTIGNRLYIKKIKR